MTTLHVSPIHSYKASQEESDPSHWATDWVSVESGQVFHRFELVKGGKNVISGQPHRIAARGARRRSALSPALVARLLELASLEPGWDEEAADPIAPSTTLAAMLLAYKMAEYASSDPSVSPMVDGSLILLWTFESGVSLEIIIEADERFPTYAMLSRPDGVVEELALKNEAVLGDLLDRQGQYEDPGIRSATYLV